MSRPKQNYDHRLRDLVRSTRDIGIATAVGVPASTARGWLRGPEKNTVTTDALAMSEDDLRTEVLRLRRRIQKLRSVIDLLAAVLRALDVDLARRRIPDGAGKSLILAAVERARTILKCRVALAVIGLSATRLHAWRRAERSCDLDDHSSCPKSSPHRLTADEIQTMKEMTTSTQYRHVPTGTLSLFAQRNGHVFASGSTWHRFARERGWRRPRLRLHPSKPRVGIRAEKPDEIWHIDTSVIRMVDGSKAYLHGLIDNYSRRILAWHVSDKFETASTVTVLLDAIGSRASKDTSPEVLTDGGGENVNGKVDELITSGLLKRTLAQTDIRFSNSMIEAWWRALKHQWLFLHTLDCVDQIKKLVAFYVEEHNERLPHSAFRGQTPDEMYFGGGDDVPSELEAARAEARRKRLEVNRALACQVCEPQPA